MEARHKDEMTTDTYKDHDTRETQLSLNKIRKFISENIGVISFIALFLCGSLLRQQRTLSNDDDDPRTKLLLTNVNGVRGSGNHLSAIATLSTNNESDLNDLCLAFRSLVNLGGDKDIPTKAPILVFNEGDLSASQISWIQSCTNRPVLFPIVNLNGLFPPGFDPDVEWEKATKFGVLPSRNRWSYAQMIRFWTTNMWKHPAVQQFETIMRIDTDSCFLEQIGENKNYGFLDVPNLSHRYVYQSNYNGDVGNPKYPQYIEGLYDFAVEYMKRENITPSHKKLWNIIQSTWEESGNLPVFQTNFEISRKTFFQRDDVRKWHESLTEQEPFGVWRHRWGDAQTRVLTMAMFGTESSVLLTRSRGYKHGRGKCASFLASQFEIQTKKEPPPTYSEDNVSSASSSSSSSWPKGVAWLMTFPNSGTMFTTDLVTKASGTATATNYGNELIKRDFDYLTTPNVTITPDGPFRYSLHPMPDGYILTKTHCAGYCTECAPSDYMVPPDFFARQCATGVKRKPNSLENMGIRYGFKIVKRAVHMWRNPFDNVVALFNNQYKVHKKKQHEKWNYSYDVDGFRNWCRDLDVYYAQEEEKMYPPEVFAVAKQVPCHAGFYQYAIWHNNALEATSELGVTTLDIYYEDFHHDMIGTTSRLLKFLEVPFRGEVSEFHYNGGYLGYFSDEEQKRAVEFLKLVCKPETYERLKVRYLKEEESVQERMGVV